MPRACLLGWKNTFRLQPGTRRGVGYRALSAPAWNHVIFSNQKNLLYGDYFVDAEPDENFMGTTIEYGSDEFKSFEDVIIYFERLGGQ